MAEQPQGKNKIVTQQDIAEALGISRSTVAMALNPLHEHKLLGETAARIKEYAARVGYRPQRFAQIMRGGRTRVVGLVVKMGVYASNHDLVVRLANELSHAGYQMVFADPLWYGEDMGAVKNYLLDQGVEGVIVCNLTVSEEGNAMKESLPPGLPFVSLQSWVDGVPTLRVDIRGAYYELTKHFLALGCRKLVYLAMFRDMGMLSAQGRTVRERMEGFAQAIQEVQGSVVIDETAREVLDIRGATTPGRARKKEIQGVVISPEKESHVRDAFENGYRQTMLLIEAGELPDAIVCMNDDTALGAMAACADHGVSVPDQVRISGYDDTAAGRFAAVPLTTVKRPLEVLAVNAVSLIAKMIETPGEVPMDEVMKFPGEVIVRRSSGTEFEMADLSEPSGNVEVGSDADRRRRLGTGSPAGVRAQNSLVIRVERESKNGGITGPVALVLKR